MDNAGKKNILLVEDEAIIAMAEASMLNRNGYAVRTAFSGQMAIEAMASSGDIDLVLMDIDLGPGLDGASAAQAITSMNSVPILFLSGHTEPEIVERTEGISCSGYVVKNSGDTVLLASIKMALRLQEARVQLQNKTAALESANRELERREKEYESLMETCPVAVGILSKRCFTLVNEVMCSTFGYSREELLGHSTRMLYGSDGAFEEFGRRFYEEILRDGRTTLPTRLYRKDGKAIEVMISGRPIDPESPDLSDGVSTAVFARTD
jgi:PAS domain S-box-containing protein